MNLLAIFFLFVCSRAFPQINDNIFGPQFLGIINGNETVPYSLPYQVGIFITNAAGLDFCGGSLISSHYVLTAAHCLDGAISARLVFGSHYINKDSEEGRVVQIISFRYFIIHPKWSPEIYLNDIALIKLVAPICETDHIKWIELAYGIESYAGKEAIVAGWGKRNNEQTNTSDVLYYITSKILGNEDCQKVDEAFNEVIKPTNLCLLGKYNNMNISTCGGDSGGPLVVDGVQVGLSSFGMKDCMVGYPSVFTRVSEYIEWIRNNTDIDYLENVY